MTTPVCMIFCTCPDEASAKRMATTLVESRLVACVNLVPKLTSIYLWEGKVTTGQEILLILKTTRDNVSRLQEAVLTLHPYDVPEFLVMPVEEGSEAYLKWVVDSTQG